MWLIEVLIDLCNILMYMDDIAVNVVKCSREYITLNNNAIMRPPSIPKLDYVFESHSKGNLSLLVSKRQTGAILF